MPKEQRYVEAHVDVDNVASICLLKRCGWEQVGKVHEAAYTSPLLGVRDSVCFRLAREGGSLLDLDPREQKQEDEPFVPDLQ
jgi:ribosomal-protein-alanine N-acetyltransferase